MAASINRKNITSAEVVLRTEIIVNQNQMD
jgi:hypothetical protein